MRVSCGWIRDDSEVRGDSETGALKGKSSGQSARPMRDPKRLAGAYSLEAGQTLAYALTNGVMHSL
jgi:hypothetical protein